MIGSLIDLLIGRLINWLVDWLVGWLIHQLIQWMTNWWIDWLIDWLVDWVVSCFVDWLIDWLMSAQYKQFDLCSWKDKSINRIWKLCYTIWCSTADRLANQFLWKSNWSRNSTYSGRFTYVSCFEYDVYMQLTTHQMLLSCWWLCWK